LETNPQSGYPEPGSLNLPEVDKEISAFWQAEDVFKRSVSSRDGATPFVFYEGPPSANGKPGIHHVIGRTIKDMFCRYRTQKGFQVLRKGGWDTHGLPVEIAVEKSLGITKEDIGTKISVEEYNAQCRKEVLKYKDIWDDLTRKMGYWVDLDDPYVTFEPDYIESVWSILKKLYDKGLIYKGYTIQPFSPAAGTGLSTHELNQPGAYKNVKDTTVTAQFKLEGKEDEFFLAWTTTPWTLPSNVALAVGPKITYVLIQTNNPYTSIPGKVWIAEALVGKYFKEDEKGEKWEVISSKKGSELAGTRYEQILPFVQPDNGKAFIVVEGDFVSTEDGTGIVHIAPSFGADDMRIGQQNGLGSLTLVDRQGKFVDEAGEFAGRYVKDYREDPDYVNVDIDIAVRLKKENRAFRVEKYEHSYPHCWRTDKPIIYYPLDSWFVKTTAVKDRMIELNKTINWKPKATGEGRFGKWLENLVDWNLSRSRFWGTPLPIWRTEDGTEEKCIGSFEVLKAEVKKAVAAGFAKEELGDDFDPHRPYVDRVNLVSDSGKIMYREPDLIDVWFDSGAMPFAQWHYPFENSEKFNSNFPADFIAEGVDQTRGWFFTLHAIATMIEDKVSFKTCVSNGLVLDKEGVKMSKRLGNVVDPFTTLSNYGADSTRWYIMSNSQPWENLRFDLEGIEKVKRKFFGTLHNTYKFYALYANIDGFISVEKSIPVKDREEIDRWVISLLNSLISDVDEQLNEYEPTRAARLIQDFVTDHLSNWYVRLCRRRFWKGAYNNSKIAAYQTLRECLLTVSQLMAPLAPFYSDWMYRSIQIAEGALSEISVHLSDFPTADSKLIDIDLEERMSKAQLVSSLVLSLRKQESLKVRQPLQKILVPVLDNKTERQLTAVRDLILSEVNVKDLEFVRESEGVFTKKIKPDFRVLGPKLGKKMKQAAAVISAFDQEDIATLEKEGTIEILVDEQAFQIELNEVEISTEDMPGWLVANESGLTVALDITMTEELVNEGNAREFVNKIQNLRKDYEFEVTDRIHLTVENVEQFSKAAIRYKDYICSEILAEELIFTDTLENGTELVINEIPIQVSIKKA
jgi:isoleucyl-tRNA synthetase